MLKQVCRTSTIHVRDATAGGYGVDTRLFYYWGYCVIHVFFQYAEILFIYGLFQYADNFLLLYGILSVRGELRLHTLTFFSSSST